MEHEPIINNIIFPERLDGIEILHLIGKFGSSMPHFMSDEVTSALIFYILIIGLIIFVLFSKSSVEIK